MNSIRFSAKRRFAAGSVAVAAVLASLALTTGTAHASGSGFCLDADAAQNFNYGQIFQWQCDDSDNYQNWTFTVVADPPGVGPLWQLQNNATGTCLDADKQDIGQGGKIIQWQCDSSDFYQLWTFTNPVYDGAVVVSGELESYGAATQGAQECLDANAQQTYDTGQITQWTCSASDPYQQWFQQSSDYDVLQNVGASS